MTEALTKANLAVPAIDTSDTLKTALAVATSVETGFAIKSREDRDQANDSAIILKRGIKTIEDALTEADRPVKRAMEARRAQYAPTLQRLKTALSQTDNERGKWDRAEAQRIREEAVRAQRAAEEAARAAAEENATRTDDEDELPPAQVPVPQVERTTRGALATSSAIRKVKAVELIDAGKAQDEWGADVVTLAARVAVEKYNAKMKLGLLPFPPDEAQVGQNGGVVIGGIRFVTGQTYSDRGSGL